MIIPLRKLILVALLAPLTASAFPPAPDHTIYGVVRDQIGNPIDITGADIVFEASSGVTVTAPIVPQLEPAVNYRLTVAMDAGLTSDLYQPTALLPAVPFRLRIKIGQTIYLPMEMTGNLAQLGVAGGRTRIDLTLGVDADGNGLPDAWEKAAAAFLGIQWSPGAIQPGAPYPGTGLTFRDVYIAGTYAVNPDDGFALRISNEPGQPPKLAFTAIKGRSYIIQSTSDFDAWSNVTFRVLPADANADAVGAYEAAATQHIEVEPLIDGSESPIRFYRLIVQ